MSVNRSAPSIVQPGVLKSVIALLGFAGALVQPPPAGSGAADVVGDLVTIGDHRLFVGCVGPAGKGPTVVLEAGGGGSSGDWALVRAQLGSGVRTCAYDRAGLGRSEKGPALRTSARRRSVARA